MHAFLQNEDNDWNGVDEFFEDGRNHHGAKTNRVCGDDDEGDLPYQCDADESIKKGGMGDGRRVFFANQIEHEIERSNDKETPDGGDPENDPGEFHSAPPAGRSLPEPERCGLVECDPCHDRRI